MTKRLKRNLFIWLLYSVRCYLILLPLQIWIPAISYSIIIGFFFGCLNEIITQLRKLNGETFEDEPEEKL